MRYARRELQTTWSGDKTGQRRLDDPNDFVRLEVETALATPGIDVIPLWVMRASTSPEEIALLPTSLRPLFDNNGLWMRPVPDEDKDLQRLIGRLTRQLETFTDADSEVQHDQTILQQARAFEAGRILMGTFLELTRDSGYDAVTFISRVRVYLSDLGVMGMPLANDTFSTTERFRSALAIINEDLFVHLPKACPFFEAATQLFITLPTNDVETARRIIEKLDLPKSLKETRTNSLQWISDLRSYFENMLLDQSSKLDS